MQSEAWKERILQKELADKARLEEMRKLEHHVRKNKSKLKDSVEFEKKEIAEIYAEWKTLIKKKN